MPVMDEFKEERESIKNAGIRKKISYFWSYYKLHTFVVLAVVLILGIAIRDVLNQKDYAIFGVILNCIELGADVSEEFVDNYIEYAGIDDSSYNVKLDTNLDVSNEDGSELAVVSAQRMLVYTSSGELDFIMAGSDVFAEYANTTIFYDIRDILSPEQITKYEPYFYYVDMDVVEILEGDDYYDDDFVAPTIPDPAKPETMKNPVPVGIFLSDSEKINETFSFSGSDYIAIGVTQASPNIDNTLKFIDYIMN